MAEILPQTHFGAVSPELAKVFARLKALDDHFRIRWALPGRTEQRPDFAVFYQDHFVFLICVSTLTAGAAKSLIEPDFASLLFSEKAVTLDNFIDREQSTLSRFTRIVARSEPSSAAHPLTSIILFPNVPQTTLNRVQKLRPVEEILLGKDSLAAGNLGNRLRALAIEPLSPAVIDTVRALFSPEVKIPSAILPKRRSNDVAPNLTRYLLDYNQEQAVKMDLALSPDAETAIAAANPRLVTGVAGSGKTLVLLYRAALLSQLEPEKRSLILTHNKPLIHDLERRLGRIIKDPAHKNRIECTHFASWCRRFFTADFPILSPWEREEAIAPIAAQVPKAAGLPLAFLCDELEWIESYDVTSLDVYLRARRAGRGRGLTEGQRRAVFEVLRKYKNFLHEKNALDWSSLPALLWEKVRAGKLPHRTYDYVFVDEAQFFAPVALKLIQSIVKPHTGQLMLAADPTQGFLKRRESWAASGLNVRRRTIRLERPYRNSRSILEYAARFYRDRLPFEDEEINLPSEDQIAQLPNGPSPELVTVRAAQDEISRTCNEVRQAIASGAKPADILIILSDEKGRQRERILSTLNESRQIVSDAQKQAVHDSARVCSINAMTGLEAPIVFLLGMSDLLQSEHSFQLAEEDRKELVRDNTRKLYTAMTRASQRLVMFERRSGAPTHH